MAPPQTTEDDARSGAAQASSTHQASSTPASSTHQASSAPASSTQASSTPAEAAADAASRASDAIQMAREAAEAAAATAATAAEALLAISANFSSELRSQSLRSRIAELRARLTELRGAISNAELRGNLPDLIDTLSFVDFHSLAAEALRASGAAGLRRYGAGQRLLVCRPLQVVDSSIEGAVPGAASNGVVPGAAPGIASHPPSSSSYEWVAVEVIDADVLGTHLLCVLDEPRDELTSEIWMRLHPWNHVPRQLTAVAYEALREWYAELMASDGI